MHIILKVIFIKLKIRKEHRERERERERGDNGWFISLFPKVYNKVFLFVGLTTLRTLW